MVQKENWPNTHVQSNNKMFKKYYQAALEYTLKLLFN